MQGKVTASGSLHEDYQQSCLLLVTSNSHVELT
jgi:hypothetical protein